ncbi:glycosyltransferase [Clostridium bowmanii]|uniref:glycosyltransferase n=1 Tax=Clostridium bowmanii TaxID=132925 RepID=UPI001C0B9EF2|nr:glycosyltransferase [Clostridium bowmanii]MBU3188428.1 glycosyltransferase [Clostridium bowmanii]MCA1072817.1 glycosyltransferase [Clostridium bowmanii]
MENLSEIKVSIIIPVYNVEDYIEKCLSSAVGQTLIGIEIIVVNDGSTDESMKIVDIFENRHSNIRVINQENGGLSFARNSGITIARGKYIAFIDSDDYIDETMIKTMYNSAEDGKLDLVACNLTKVDDTGKVIGEEKNAIDCNCTYDKVEGTREYLLNNIPSYAWNKLYRRTLFIDNKISYPVGRLYEDIGTTFELLFNAHRIGFINESLYFYVQREGAITKVPTYKAGGDIINTVDEIKSTLSKSEIYYKYDEAFKVFSLKYLFLANVLFYKRYSITKDKNELECFKNLSRVRIEDLNHDSIMQGKWFSLRDKINYMLMKTGTIYLAITIKETLLKVERKLWSLRGKSK